MPSRESIQNELRPNKPDDVRRKYLRELSELTGRDTIIYFAGFGSKAYSGIKLPHHLVSITSDDVQGFMAAIHGLKNSKLDIVLHSGGGSLEAAEQLVNYLRSKFEDVRAIVPDKAMSAATMIACACDSIVMGKHSALGPIDPQLSLGQGPSIPVLGILEEFERAKREISENPKVAPIWAARFQKLPIGMLSMCEAVKDRSVTKVAEWLNSYMLKDKDASERIALWLAKWDEHKNHGRPLGIDSLVSAGLKIEPLEDNQPLQEAVLSVYHSSVLTLEQTNCVKFIENQDGKGFYTNINVEPPKK